MLRCAKAKFRSATAWLRFRLVKMLLRVRSAPGQTADRNTDLSRFTTSSRSRHRPLGCGRLLQLQRWWDLPPMPPSASYDATGSFRS